MICVSLQTVPAAPLTSALVPEVWEEDVFLGEDKQAQPASCQGVIVDGARVGKDLPALVHQHPARGEQQAGECHRRHKRGPSWEVRFEEQVKRIHSALRCPVTRPDCRPSRRRCWTSSLHTFLKVSRNVFKGAQGVSSESHSFFFCFFFNQSNSCKRIWFYPRKVLNVFWLFFSCDRMCAERRQVTEVWIHFAAYWF